MKKFFSVFTFILMLCAGAAKITLASTTDGTIDPTKNFAWSENYGWVNFAPSQGNVHVTDSGLSGYAWSENLGWINLAPTGFGVKNDAAGNLSGFAWGAGIGWINFSYAKISSAGRFSGYAYSVITGKISFDCLYCDVETDWRPLSVRSGAPPPAPPAPAAQTEKVPPTVVTFSGHAFPGARVTLIDKSSLAELPISQTTVSSDDGQFSISYVGVLQADHLYGLVVSDKDGRRTQTKFFNINTVANSLTQKDIFIPPTAELYRSAVTRGDFIRVIGYSLPVSNIMVQIDNGITYESTSSPSGAYAMLINTAGLSLGRHSLRAKQQDRAKTEESDWSTTKSFSVVSSVIPEADLDGDGVVDVKDWSIFLSLWKSADPEARKILDLNHDGKIDLTDLSLFLRAYRQKK